MLPGLQAADVAEDFAPKFFVDGTLEPESRFDAPLSP